MKIGIMAAMPEEIYTISSDMTFDKIEKHAQRKYYFGMYQDIELISVYSRCGKVSAASTATTLIERYHVDYIIFTGVAGAVDPNLLIGDIVLADACYQHDMDGTPLFPKFEIPLTGYSILRLDLKEITIAKHAIRNFIVNINDYIPTATLQQFMQIPPKLNIGTIATGDQFIKNPLHHDTLKYEGHHVLAVEMEGAAVAQVCMDHAIPYVLIRTISDKADHSAHVDFPSFIENIASHYSSGIIREFLKCFCARTS